MIYMFNACRMRNELDKKKTINKFKHFTTPLRWVFEKTKIKHKI